MSTPGLGWFLKRTLARLVAIGLFLGGVHGFFSFLGLDDELEKITSQIYGVIVVSAIVLAGSYVWLVDGFQLGQNAKIDRYRANGRAAGPKKRKPERRHSGP